MRIVIPGGTGHVGAVLARARDLVRAIDLLIDRELDGPVNAATPNPLPQRELMAALRTAPARRIGLPATAWMARIGAFVMRTEAELILKSRRVVPLLEAGFTFEHPTWLEAARDLVARRNGAA